MDKNLKKLLAEDVKKFRMLAEYDFFLEEDDEEVPADGPEPPQDGGQPGGAPPAPDMGGGEEMPELDMDGNPVSQDPQAGGGEGEMDMDMGDMPSEPEGEVNFGGEEGGDDDFGDMGGEDEVELDITELVDATDEAKATSEKAKASSDDANKKLIQLIKKFQELEQRMPKMDMLGKKLEDIQADIAKRNPTEEEKLELRSFNSYPYNIKLTDYWSDKIPGYDVDNGEGQKFKEPEEYVLTQDDVDSEYSELSVRNTFDYDEEDI